MLYQDDIEKVMAVAKELLGAAIKPVEGKVAELEKEVSELKASLKKLESNAATESSDKKEKKK